jgi:hypothetical protein
LKSCDAYYNVSKGTYKGDAIYYGVYKTSYSSATKQQQELLCRMAI